MKRVRSIAGLVSLAGVAVVAVGCSGDSTNEVGAPGDGVGSTQEMMTKCQNTVPNEHLGEPWYCADSTCPCTWGEGDCDRGSVCAGTSPIEGASLVCNGKGPYFGLPAGTQACAPSHCNNSRLDGSETQIDCGGDCGSVCPSACSTLPPLGSSGHCADPTCPCTWGQGDCDAGNVCAGTSPVEGAALTCVGKGPYFGLPTGTQACAPNHCVNGKIDGSETQVDCGGDCGSTCPNTCGSATANGAAGHCATTCPCPALEGGCTASSQCQPGLSCLLSHGIRFGFAESLGGCQATSCSNGAKDGTETDIDCGGGSCPVCSQTAIFSKGFGGSTLDTLSDVAVDSKGNIFIAGLFSGSVDFGGGALTASGQDIFIAKLDGRGNHLWSKSFGGPSNDGDGDVVVASDGTNLYLGGNAYAGADFGAGAITTTGPASDAFIVKLDYTTGAPVWSKTYGGLGEDRVTGIGIRGGGPPVIVGSFVTSINLGGATFTSTNPAPPPAIHDVFVASLSGTNGSHVWSRAFGSSGNDEGTDIAVHTSTGNVFVSGFFSGTVDFGTGGKLSKGGTDAFLVKLGVASGSTLMVQTWGGGSADRANTVAVGTAGNPVVGGFFNGSVDFGGGVHASSGSADAFIVSSDGSTGAYRWSKEFGGSGGSDQVFSLAVDAATSNVLAVGQFTGSVDFGSGTAIAASGGGGPDAFIARYNDDGSFGWASAYGGTGQDAATGAGVFDTVAVLGGWYNGTPSFGGSALTNAGGRDVVMATYRF